VSHKAIVLCIGGTVMKNQLNRYVCFWPCSVFFKAALISWPDKFRAVINDLNRDREDQIMHNFRLISQIES